MIYDWYEEENNHPRSWKKIKMVCTSLTLQTTTSSVPSFKWRRRVVRGRGVAETTIQCGGCGGGSIERWHEVTWRLSTAEQTLLCGRKRLAGTFQPCRVFTGDRPPVLSAPAPAAPGRNAIHPGQTACSSRRPGCQQRTRPRPLDYRFI